MGTINNEDETQLELLTELASKSLGILKSTYIYITALSGLIIILGLTKDDLVDIVISNEAFIILFFALITVSLLLNEYIYNIYVRVKVKKTTDNLNLQSLSVILSALPFMHLLLICCFCFYYMGFFSGKDDFSKDYYLQVQIQGQIEKYKEVNGNYPKNVETLKQSTNIEKYVDKMRNDLWYYEYLENNSYKLIFDTGNGTINEDDDIVFKNDT